MGFCSGSPTATFVWRENSREVALQANPFFFKIPKQGYTVSPHPALLETASSPCSKRKVIPRQTFMARRVTRAEDHDRNCFTSPLTWDWQEHATWAFVQEVLPLLSFGGKGYFRLAGKATFVWRERPRKVALQAGSFPLKSLKILKILKQKGAMYELTDTSAKMSRSTLRVQNTQC